MTFNEIRIYFGGDRALKPGFNRFFADLRTRARERRCRFQLISSGSGSAACRDFAIALRTHKDAWNILLMDAEGPLPETFCKDQGWDGSHDNSIFWMVQMMESWFHADKDALEQFYGRDFNRNALRKNPRVEEILRNDVESGLKEATRHTKKGNYFENKTSHGPALLSQINCEKVRNAAPGCERMFAAVLMKLA